MTGTSPLVTLLSGGGMQTPLFTQQTEVSGGREVTGGSGADVGHVEVPDGRINNYGGGGQGLPQVHSD